MNQKARAPRWPSGTSAIRLAAIETVSGHYVASRSSSPPPSAPDVVTGDVDRAGRLLEALSATDHQFVVRPHRSPDPSFPGYALESRSAFADYRFLFQARPDGSVDLTHLERYASRRSPKTPAPPAVELRYRHPFDGSAARLAVRFLSRDTAVCAVDGADARLCVGMVLPEMEIRWKGGALPMQGRVLSRETIGQSTATLALHPPSRATAARWTREHDRLAHPRTSLGASDPEDLWRLFEESGYFHLSDKDPSDFEALRRAFVRSSRALAAAPELGGQVDYADRDGVDCSVTTLRSWSRSTLLYHVARRPERPLTQSGNASLYEAYRHTFDHMALDPDLRWLVVYIQFEGARFTRLLHKDFPEQHADGRKAAIVPFHARAGRTDGALPPRPGSGWEHGPAPGQELAMLARRIRALRPPAYAEALDLVESRIGTDPMGAAWSRAGLARDRAVWVARRHGQPQAAAVMELAEDGLHLFGLLDVVRTFPLAPGGSQAFPLLLRAARAWYARRGKRFFTYFDEWSDGAADALDLESLGGAWWTVTDVDLIPDLHETLLIATAPGVRP